MMEARENVKAGNLDKGKPRNVVTPEEKGLLDSRKHMTYEMKLPGDGFNCGSRIKGGWTLC